MKVLLKLLILTFLWTGCADQMNPRTKCRDHSYFDEKEGGSFVESKECTLTIYWGQGELNEDIKEIKENIDIYDFIVI